ncbi:FAD/NAD(P)-binding oxidoreductase [Aliigemmobacter aestuarii]|uniref:FAD/NAD(P)-binding oxidoreductase n=1 Tax=Aliigemmobacter aestuarii TaxID=1445661 RepID=A0A4V3V0N0_9RHOB|nr:NAD(P)/FAD-dependent oxidoreductase [Gemmobacter aestuarii]THD84512.1 FAD/NAD(P)-binding oxidoreductase [Gemmobacter aestuarii]
MTRPAPVADSPFDAAIIGGGVIGCALARRFTLEGARVVLIERAADVLDGASKGNSAILHTGFDAPPGSLELACVQAGYREYLDIHESLNLPLIRSGAMVIAWTEDEATALPDLIAQARENGVDDVEPLTVAGVRALEAGLGPGVRAAFRVPGEYLVDPWSAPHAYLRQAVENGARLMTSAALLSAEYDGAAWHLDTARGPVRARFAINAAGNFGDLVDEILHGRRDFTLRPRKGQFVVYDKAAARLAGHILLPVPSKITKGIVVCRTAFGNLIVGPTAEDQDDRARAELVPETLAALMRRGEEILPGLKGMEVTATYAGLRPATEFKDYQIRAHDGRAAITVGGIRSTGLSSALGTARHVWGLAQGMGLAGRPVAAPVVPRMPALTDEGTRDWQCPGNGGIVCHCEMVTRREIEAALSGPIPAQTLAGLKRRTRVTMGRCQGFYCSAELARITAGRLAVPMTGDADIGSETGGGHADD